MRLILFLILLSFFLSPFLGVAQKNTMSLYGIISDETNGESLAGATVTARSRKSSQRVYVISSNEYGYYNFFLPEEAYSIAVFYVGYVEKQDTVSRSAQKNYALDRRTQQLEEIAIYSNKQIGSTNMSSHKVEMENIQKLPVIFGEVDILKTIQLLPGVNTSGDNSSGFSVRGGATDQNLVFLDEAPVYNTSHAFGLFSTFNGDAVKNFTLYKGGIPARYGGRLSSVLDVRQYDGNNKKIQLKGGIGFISGKLSIQGPLFKKKGKDFSDHTFFIAGRRTYFDLFIPLVVTDEANQNNIVFFHDINAKLSFRLGKKDRLFISTYYGYDFFSVQSLISSGWGNTAATLRWNHLYGKKFFSNISAVYSKYNYELDFKRPSQGFNWRGSIENFFLKGLWEYTLSQKQSMHFGFNLNYINVNPGLIIPKDDNSRLNVVDLQNEYGIESAVFVEGKRTIGKNIKIHAGLRLNWFARLAPQVIRTYPSDEPVVYNSLVGIYQNASHSGVSSFADGVTYSHLLLAPRINISYAISSRSALKFSYNRMAQYMQILSTNTNIVPTDIYRLSGQYIKPAIADQLAFGFNYDMVAAKPQHALNLSIETFYKFFSDLTSYRNGADLIRNDHIETELLDARGYAYGIEFMLSKPRGKLTGWISYTYSSSIREGVDLHLGGPGVNNGIPFSSNQDIPSNLSMTVNYNFSDRLSASAIFTYKTGKPTTYPSSKYDYEPYLLFFLGNLEEVALGREIVHYEKRNVSRFPDYHRLDFNLTYTGKKRKRYQHKWVLSLFNVYARQNPISIFFSSDEEGNKKAQQLSIYGFIPSITWQFMIN